MFGIIFLVICVALIVIPFTIEDNYDNDGIRIASFLTGGVGLIAVIIITAIGYTTLINKEAEYSVMNDKLLIQNERRENVTEQLKTEVTNYIAYEKSVFDGIKADNINSFIFKFPELKTIESIKILMEQIAKLNEGYYQMMFAKKDYEAYFRSVNNNKISIYSSDFK